MFKNVNKSGGRKCAPLFYALSRHFLDGLTGCHRFFKLSIYRCGITLKTCSTPRVYILYKNACQPRQPVKIRLFSSLEGRFFLSFKTSLRSIQNALAFKVKRPCVSSQTHLRFRLNALAFFCLPICLKVRNGFRVGFICMGYSLRGEYFKYNHL